MPGPKRILVADDRLGMHSMIKEALFPHGFEVEIAENGYEVLEKISNNEFDLILLDKKMPGLSGIQALGMVKEMKPDLPVIIMSAGDELELKEEAKNLGANGYLFKPFNLAELLEVISDHLVKP